VDAQFSMPFGAAIALLHHSAALDQFTEENARSQDVRLLMSRVVMTKDIRIEKNFPQEWPARVEIHLADGRRFESFVRHPRGDPQNPLTWDDVAAKFRSLASAVFDDDRCDRIEKYVRSLVLESDLRGLAALLAP